MKNVAIELYLKKGEKNNKKWFALVIKHNYESGKSFTELVFINESEFTHLLQTGYRVA